MQQLKYNTTFSNGFQCERSLRNSPFREFNRDQKTRNLAVHKAFQRLEEEEKRDLQVQILLSVRQTFNLSLK